MNPTEVKFKIQCGSKMIHDLLNPQPEEIDMEGIDANLKTQKRWGSHPLALTIHRHRHLVRRLAELDPTGYVPDNIKDAVLDWCEHHDDHEGVIGDIVQPIKGLISSRTNVLEIVETQLDIATCIARGAPAPTDEVRALVYHYDKTAETLEWYFALNNPIADWNYPVPSWLPRHDAQRLVHWAMVQ